MIRPSVVTTGKEGPCRTQMTRQRAMLMMWMSESLLPTAR